MKTKIGTEVAHVTRDSDSTFKVKWSRSPGRFTRRRVGASGSCSGGHGNVMAVRNCSTLPSARPREALRRPRGVERGGGISWRPPAYSLLNVFYFSFIFLLFFIFSLLCASCTNS